MHVARLVVVTELKNVPPEMRPFVEFKAAVQERTVGDEELVALLVVDTTTCYIPVFLKEPGRLSELEKELEAQDARLAADSREVLAKYMPP
jgi:hypothetical protein